MVRATSRARFRTAAAALVALAVLTAPLRVAAVDSPGAGVWRAGATLNGCATIHAANPDALPGSVDPATLMRALRQHGLASAGATPRGRGTTGHALARGTGQGSLRCDAPGPGAVFGGTPLGRGSNRD